MKSLLKKIRKLFTRPTDESPEDWAQRITW